jgi:hypothetical protein
MPPPGALRYATAGLAMNFERQSRSRGAELLLVAVALVLPFKAMGCGRTACFTVTSADLKNGACPDVMAAAARLEGPACAGQANIASVDGAGTLDNGLCCYPVTFGDTNPAFVPCGAGGSFTVTTGISVESAMVGVGASSSISTMTGTFCVKCKEFLAGMSGPLCSGFALTNEVAVQNCACTATSCQTDCDQTLCGPGNAPDDACRACLLQGCAMEVTACQGN